VLFKNSSEVVANRRLLNVDYIITVVLAFYSKD
jgi:hypothetical protein